MSGLESLCLMPDATPIIQLSKGEKPIHPSQPILSVSIQ